MNLLPIKDKPLLEHTLRALKDQGLTEIYISVAHLGKKIKDYFGDGARLGVRIKYIEQTETKNGTAQPVIQAKEFLSGKCCIL